MACPIFLAIETCPEAPYYPIACAWSMTDGLIKSSFIQPADHWPSQLCYGDQLSLDTIMAQGHSIKDIILEMNNDLDSEQVTCHRDFPIEESLAHLQDTLDIYPSFDWSQDDDNLSELLGENWREDIADMAFRDELFLNQAEDQVRLMLKQWALTHHYDIA